MLNFYAKFIEFTILSEHALTQNKCTVVTSSLEPGGVGHGPSDQFCPITSLQMAD